MKKYSEKYINSYKLLQNAIVGFEFECFFNTSFYKTLENLNHDLSPVQIHGFRKYHTDFAVDAKNFKLERDLSGGVNMAELITGAMDYHTAKYYLVKILKFIQTYGYTTDKSSLHINISFKDKSVTNLNVLKQILTTDEDEIYKIFPSRKNNIYAKSIKKMIPFKDYDFSNVSISAIKNMLRLPNDKYYGINFMHINDADDSKRIEFRYIGGKDYEYKTGDIMDIMDEFILNSYNNISAPFTEKEFIDLTDYLNNQLNIFKSFETYDKFLVEFPKYQLQVDGASTYDIVNAYYASFQKKLYELIESVDDLGDTAIINLYTAEQKIEVVEARFKTVFNISNFTFINCDVYDGIFENCEFVNCKITNSQINKSKIDNSEIFNSKIYFTNTNDSTLENCYFEGGVMNSEMIGGVLRSGKIGGYANISSTTNVVNDDAGNNFFNTKTESDDDKKQGGKGKN